MRDSRRRQEEIETTREYVISGTLKNHQRPGQNGGTYHRPYPKMTVDSEESRRYKSSVVQGFLEFDTERSGDLLVFYRLDSNISEHLLLEDPRDV